MPRTIHQASLISALIAGCLLADPLANGGFAQDEPFRVFHDCTVRFASADEAYAAITADDLFTRNLSRFDLQVRLRTDQAVDLAACKQMIREEVRDWSEGDRAKINAALASLRDRLTPLKPKLPDEFVLAFTTGKEEAGAAYCRGKTIVLPKNVLTRDRAGLEALLLHEMFHVMSTTHPELRPSLYGIVGFEACEPIAIHPSLKDRRISNPDAPQINCTMELIDGGRTYRVAPVLYASTDYCAAEKKTLFDYMQFRLMVVNRKGAGWEAAEHEGRAVVIDPKKSDAFLEKLGKNTSYIIHPEEVLADNFTYLVLGLKNVNTPRILTELGTAIKR